MFKVGDRVKHIELQETGTVERCMDTFAGSAQYLVVKLDDRTTRGAPAESWELLESKSSPVPENWKEEGRCSKCGELGPYCPKTLVPVCSVHGPY